MMMTEAEMKRNMMSILVEHSPHYGVTGEYSCNGCYVEFRQGYHGFIQHIVSLMAAEAKKFSDGNVRHAVQPYS